MNHAIEKLLDKYYEGETTLEEERELRDFFQQDDIPHHLQLHAEQFRYFAKSRKQQPSAGTSYRIVTQLNTQPKVQPKVRPLVSWGMRIAAGITLLLVGFAGGLMYTNRTSAQAETDNAEVAAMKSALRFEQVNQTSASERIHAVNQSVELGKVDADITQMLINTMNFDENVNVRLAACQALSHFENEPLAREGLIQSLRIQTDPNVQLTLIEILVSIKEKRAAEEMQRLAGNKEVMDVVRMKAEEGVTHLNQLKKNSTS
ncbi:HEAT repeat domain-containing protein [Runella sp.]|uniref:HEAT repeat domain-containing protein n=1 Tax=Runella sp. TaxID=1960881 RepID=UPI003D0AC0D0